MPDNNCHGTCYRKLIGLVLAFLLALTGCGTFGSSKVVQQLQNENERLVAEFRAQRDQNVQLSQRLNDAQARLAESEKMLARLTPLSPGQRLSRLGSDNSTNFQNSGLARPTQNGDRTNAASAPATSSVPDKNSALTKSDIDFQWRPMRKESK